MSYAPVNTSRVNIFPLTPAESEKLRECSTIKIKLLGRHALLNIFVGKVYIAHVSGRARATVKITVTKVSKRGGSTFARLERKFDE